MSEEQTGRTLSVFGTEQTIFELNLSNKELKEIPDDESLSKVRKLDVSKNQLQSLHFLAKCESIIELNASENQISGGFEIIESRDFLSFLDLSSNVIESLSGFPMNENLVSLNLSNNHIIGLADLPELPSIKELNVSGNEIKELELRSFPSLRILNISHNQISELVLPALPSLRILDASYNVIEKIQKFQREDLPFVWKCDLRGNAIATPETCESLTGLPMLYSLMISENPVVADESNIPRILVILPTLAKIDDKDINAKAKVKASLKVAAEKDISTE